MRQPLENEQSGNEWEMVRAEPDLFAFGFAGIRPLAIIMNEALALLCACVLPDNQWGCKANRIHRLQISGGGIEVTFTYKHSLNLWFREVARSTLSPAVTSTMFSPSSPIFWLADNPGLMPFRMSQWELLEMPILSGGSDQDYSNISYASCNSLSHFFPVSVETPSVKGVHYQRARRIYRPDQASAVDLKTEIMINVGGIKYLLPWSTLDEFPLTRLSKLKFCSSYEEIIQLCDDYDEDTREFFFDRNPNAFGMIVSFLAAGKLMLLRDMCALSFQEELRYWGIEESNLENCCFRKLFQKLQELAEVRKEEELRRSKEAACVLDEKTKFGQFMNRLRDMVENPQSGLPGKVFACLSILFVATTAISLCVSTMPDLRAEEDRVSKSSLTDLTVEFEEVCLLC